MAQDIFDLRRNCELALTAISLGLVIVPGVHSLEVVNAVHCDGQIGAKGTDWCLDGQFAKGRAVGFLERKDCRAVTGDSHPVVNEIGETTGTSLINFSCPTAKDNDLVVLDTKVKRFSKLEIKPVPKEKFPKDIDAKLRGNPMFGVLATRGPDQAAFPPATFELRLTEIVRPGMTGNTYVATYTEEGEIPFLITPSSVTALSTTGGSGGGATQAFRLNERDFVVISICELGTDGCGTSYVELGK